MSRPVIQAKNLHVLVEGPDGPVPIVDGVSFEVKAGETLALVGESGSGKSVTARCLLRLIPPHAWVETGEVLLEGRDLLTMPTPELRRVRGREVAMVFQDPMTALNPYLTVGRQLGEVLEVHEGLRFAEARERVVAALDEVGFPDASERMEAYPHQLSGGLRQRATIAMALLCRPKVLIADEPTTALDVTIQDQVLSLFERLQEEHGTAILLITHDLGVVARLADRVNVMYAGKLVERGGVDDVFHRPMHPYTFGLLRSVPTLTGPIEEKLPSIPGQPPDPTSVPPGCAFHPRCPFAIDRCARERPPLAMTHAPTGPEELQRARLEVEGRRRESACWERDRVAELTALWNPSIPWTSGEVGR